MSHVVVFNSYAKTIRIPTTPTKYLTEVRDEACQKFGVSKEQFTLKYNNKPISLSQQIRLANLPQGARLELVQASRSPTVISVALQLPASEKNVRLTQKFASNTSLWEILRHFESGQGTNYNFTQRGVPEMSGTSGAGRLNYETPVITVMPGHREHSDLVALQQTLSQLGFDSGSALLKLSYKNSGIPLEEAMAQISQYFKSEPPVQGKAEGAYDTAPTQSPSVPSSDQAISKAKATVADETVPSETFGSKESAPEEMEIDPRPEDDTPTTTAVSVPTSTVASQPSDQTRNVQIFSAPTSSTPQAARKAFNESDYLPTIEHAKAHQAQLLDRTRNQRLPSDKELEEQEKAKQEKIEAAAAKGGALRIRLPDQNIIQMSFGKGDTAEIVYDFVKGFLDHKEEPFELKYTGPTGRLVLIAKNKKRLMQDLRFSSNELITFQWAENASAEVRSSRKTLASEWQAKAQALKVEEPETVEKPQATSQGQTVAEGKRKKEMSSEDKESKLKNILGKGLFKRK